MIQNADTINTKDHYVKMLLYGEAGSGKTRFCADAPKPFWFDYESSTETLRHWPEFQDIPVKKPKSIEELRTDVQNCVQDPDIETVVIDSITTSLDYFLRQRMKSIAAKSNSRDQYILYEEDYKYATQVFTDLFGFLQDSPINVVIIGHERIHRDPVTGSVLGIFPDVTPRLQQAVTRLVNVVGYLQASSSSLKGRTRKLYVNKTPIIEAKNRLNLQEIFLENPEWKNLYE